MLVARRDPPFHAGAHDAAPVSHDVLADVRPPRLVRFATVMQLVGSLIAVPIGLASAYSIYRANFSPETTCQSLRAGIVAMLDKNMDAGTRRILVRRDVEAFEQNCGSVDPDAVAAFKALLTAEKKPVTAASVSAPAAPVAQHSEAPAKEAVRKVEPQPQQIVKQAPVVKTPDAEPIRRDAAVSDTQWLEAVRQAMAAHREEQPSDKVEKPRAAAPPPRPAQEAVAQPDSVPAVAAPAPVAAPMELTPAPAPVTAAAPQPDADHPVPPGAIPDPAEVAAAKPDKPRSRIGRWIARVPLLGPVWENGQQ